MWHPLRLRMTLGNLAIADPATACPPVGFRGFPHLLPGSSETDRATAVSSCPSAALAADGSRLDLGCCLFCGRCATAAPMVIEHGSSPRLAASTRGGLVLNPGETADQYASRAVQPRQDLRQLFGRSLKLRQVSAGGCNACELELNACSNLNFDMGRYGIEFVASPRHADGIVITGPVSAAMAGPLRDTLAAVPEPRLVIACGACAISGGPFAGSVALDRSGIEKIQVDLWIPGCPPHPLTFIQGILDLLHA